MFFQQQAKVVNQSRQSWVMLLRMIVFIFVLESRPGNTKIWFEVKPSWMRYTDFSTDPPTIFETS